MDEMKPGAGETDYGDIGIGEGGHVREMRIGVF
jgi:hypothetical protein